MAALITGVRFTNNALKGVIVWFDGLKAVVDSIVWGMLISVEVSFIGKVI